MSVCIYVNYFGLLIATIFFIMMLVGSSIQTDGWILYQPNGTFVTLQLPPYEQQILTQCSGPTANANHSYPTVRFLRLRMHPNLLSRFFNEILYSDMA